MDTTGRKHLKIEDFASVQKCPLLEHSLNRTSQANEGLAIYTAGVSSR